MLTRKAKYGLKALLYLTEHQDKGAILIADISKEERIPQKFLESILLELRREGILDSKRGKGGGYYLKASPNKIRMGQILRILDGPLAPISCVSKNFYKKCSDCPDEGRCRIRGVMGTVRDSIAGILDSITLTQFANPRLKRRTK